MIRKSRRGIYHVQEFKGGVFTVVVQLTGYQTQMLNQIEIGRGQSFELNVQLDKI